MTDTFPSPVARTAAAAPTISPIVTAVKFPALRFSRSAFASKVTFPSTASTVTPLFTLIVRQAITSIAPAPVAVTFAATVMLSAENA
ncbi:hypothetical protein LzC2_26430 [Planctomycetes bacterium LzC2]|uniref:50S ribosomal protein L7/L12 n=1 Tax=Alienimonas chondri TaxID=2681879 RepID=A0ABX1VFN7_9PLAN|nr:hypothetical protein [Alienimonas chondri]